MERERLEIKETGGIVLCPRGAKLVLGPFSNAQRASAKVKNSTTTWIVNESEEGQLSNQPPTACPTPGLYTRQKRLQVD